MAAHWAPAGGSSPSPRVIGATRKLVAALDVEELRWLVADVVRTELAEAGATPGGPQRSRGVDLYPKYNTSGESVDHSFGSNGKRPDSDTKPMLGDPEVVDGGDHSESGARASAGVWQSVRTIRGIQGAPRLELKEEKSSTMDALMFVNPGMYHRIKQCSGYWQQWVGYVEEPERSGRLVRIVESKLFEGFFSLVIVLNALFMAAAMNYQVAHPFDPPKSFMRISDVVFLCLYSIELGARLAVHRLFFFCSSECSWNIMDFTLVVYGIIDAGLDMISSNGGQSPGWLRALRLFKMAKVLRMLRVIKFLKELHLIMSCILGSLHSLGWSLVLMAVILYMFSLAFVQQASAYLGSGNSNPIVAASIVVHFGSIQSSVLTLFKAIFGGDDWSTFHDLTVEMGVVSDWLFLFFVAFSQIALLNILTGIFVESALKLAEPNFYDKADEHHAVKAEQARVLKEMCLAWDANASGSLSKEEFMDMLQSPRVIKFLHYLGLEVPSVDTFFNMLGSFDKDGNVDIDKFVDGCMRLRGEARSVDLNQLLYEVKCIGMLESDNLGQMRRDVRFIRQHIGDLFGERSAQALSLSPSSRRGDRAGTASASAARRAASAGRPGGISPGRGNSRLATSPESPTSSPTERPTRRSCLPLFH